MLLFYLCQLASTRTSFIHAYEFYLQVLFIQTNKKVKHRHIMHLSLSSRGGGGGRGSGNPREFDCHVYPQGRDFDRTSHSQGGEFWHGRHLGTQLWSPYGNNTICHNISPSSKKPSTTLDARMESRYTICHC